MLLHFVKGDSLKKKEGIQACSREVKDLPIGFPKAHQELGRQLFFAIRDEDITKRFEQVKKLILDHRELLNSFYQYAYSGNIAYEKPKSSKVYLFTFDAHSLECKFNVVKKMVLLRFSDILV